MTIYEEYTNNNQHIREFYKDVAKCGGAAHQGVTFPAKAKQGGRSVSNERVNAQTRHLHPSLFAFSRPHVIDTAI